MRKLLCAGLALVFVFTFVFSYMFVVNSQTAFAGESACCKLWTCEDYPPAPPVYAWGCYDGMGGCYECPWDPCDSICNILK